jgi:hypothetical protein
MAKKAIQVSLKSMHFDRFTTHTMRGYVVCLAQRNIDGEGQLYASQTSFRVRRDGQAKTKEDEVYCWQGDGEMVFSTALDGLECIGLEAYFIRDNRNIRDFGTVLADALDEDGDTGRALAAVLSAAATAAGGPAAPVIALAQPAARFVGKLLAKKKDKVKIRADGSLRVTTLMHEFAVDPDADNDIDVPWGVRKRADGAIQPDADRGYFLTQWSLVETANPDAQVVTPTLPDALVAKFND